MLRRCLGSCATAHIAAAIFDADATTALIIAVIAHISAVTVHTEAVTEQTAAATAHIVTTKSHAGAATYHEAAEAACIEATTTQKVAETVCMQFLEPTANTYEKEQSPLLLERVQSLESTCGKLQAANVHSGLIRITLDYSIFLEQIKELIASTVAASKPTCYSLHGGYSISCRSC